MPSADEFLNFKEELRIVFVVNNYEQTRTFYEIILGLPVFNEWDRTKGDRGVIYTLGNTLLEILEGEQAPVSEGFYVYVEVKDVDVLWQKLSPAVEVIDQITPRPWGHRNFSVKDPNGFKIKFFSKV